MEKTTVKKLTIKFLNYLEVERNRSPRTIKSYEYDLGRFLEFLGSKGVEVIEQVSGDIIEEFYYSLEKESISPSGATRRGNSPTSRARKLSTIRSFFNFLVKKGITDTNPSGRVDFPYIEDKESSYLTEEQIKYLMNTVKATAPRSSRLRDYTILLTFIYTGIRLSELAKLNIGDVDFENGEMRVRGKGRKIRFLPFNGDLRNGLKEYIDERRHAVADTNALFLSKLRSRISPRGIHHIVKKYLNNADFTDRKYSTHSLRHAFLSLHYKSGTSPLVIQKLAGHKNLQTTQRYLHDDWDAQMRKAVDRVSLQLGGLEKMERR